MYDTAYNLDLHRFKAPNIVFCKVSGALVHVPEKLGSSINFATNDFGQALSYLSGFSSVK